MSPVKVGVLTDDDVGIRIDDDGTCLFHPDCIAYPDDESAYSGVLDTRHGVLVKWAPDTTIVTFDNGITVNLSDAIYQAIQHGLIRVGAR